MAETDLSTWLLVDETAQQIGCSKRTVERLARAKQLEQRLRRQEGTPPVAVYNPDDVHRIATERRTAPPPFVLPATLTEAANRNGHRGDQLGSVTKQLVTTSADDDPIRQLFAAALRAVLSPPSPPSSPPGGETLFVTIPEASALTGLTQAYLRRQIEGGTLKAIRDRGWRIRRTDLEQL